MLENGADIRYVQELFGAQVDQQHADLYRA